MGRTPLFDIVGNMVLVIPPDAVPVSASINVDDEGFETLSEQEGFMSAPYLARNQWIYLDDIRRLSTKQWETY